MAYYAFVDSNNKVVSVISGRNEDEVVEGISDWEAYYSSKRPGLTALRTSCNTFGGVHLLGDTPLRKNYAGIGYTYDEARDAFIPPKPYESWVLNEDTCLWEAPVPRPEGDFVWDEDAGDWMVIDETI